MTAKRTPSPRLWIRARTTKITIFKQEQRGGKAAAITHPSLTIINRQLKHGTIQIQDAHRLAKELLLQLRPQKPKAAFGGINNRLLQQYWGEVVRWRRHEDPKAALNRLIRGVRGIEPLSLHVATKEQLTACIGSLPIKQARETTAVVNQFLKWLGKPFALAVPKTTPTSVTHITETQLQQLMPYLPSDTLRYFFAALFYTGCRVGEIFAAGRIQKEGGVIYIDRQIKRDGREAGLKNKQVVAGRRAIIDHKGRSWVRQWVGLSQREKMAIRNVRHCDILQIAAMRADVWAENKQPLTCNALRHSYAIHWLEKGATITHVSQLLGNSEAVCQRHYAGFIITDVGIEALLRL